MNWNKGELDKTVRSIQKLLNIQKGLQSRPPVDRLYIRRDQGRRLLSVKDCVQLERSNFFDYAAKNSERFLKATTE